jgi:pimeloyl-ACP methyl ester carboxylesterase
LFNPLCGRFIFARVPASILLEVPLYYPNKSAGKVKCPTLIIGAKHDSLIPIEAVKKMAGCIPNAEFVELDSNHFEPYVEPLFEQNIRMQIDFLKKHFVAES